MTLVIVWSVADVAWVLYQRLMELAYGRFADRMDDILVSFSAFMVTLIAIEILSKHRSLSTRRRGARQTGACHGIDGYRPQGDRNGL
jgi:hypothetical protein